MRSWNIDHSIDNDMTNMHALRTVLTCDRLRQCPESEFLGRKSSEVGRSLQRGGGAGVDECWRV